VETELNNYETRLKHHFSTLHNHRSSVGVERPIFALEHGLNELETSVLESALRTHIKSQRPSKDHSLSWIVYSSEIGYRYSGDEYWQTFERETPGWNENENRHWLRRQFQNFQKEFGGAVPTGVWAEHFSIICWPITHAILPKDLQRQLARILYELRNSLSGEILESPKLLGELIASRSWNATSRFQNLTQETLLLGQIATALLLQGEPDKKNLIFATTLARIREDLEQVQTAREWLRSARQTARERTRVKGLVSLNQSLKPVNFKDLEVARSEVFKLGIEPRLVLRSIDTSGDSWDVLLELPNFSHLPLRFSLIGSILTGSRCSVAGNSDRPLARGRLLYGTTRVPLKQWPKAQEVLLQFEPSDPQIDYLLRTECLLRPNVKWLFRIASDGLAYECRNLRVRPGQQYILISQSKSERVGINERPIVLSCEGIHGTFIELPSALDTKWEETLRSLGLQQSKTVQVWPAGLAAASWDGDGNAEWLASERPCVSILTDHPVASLHIKMDDDVIPALELKTIVPGQPVYLMLPQFPVGHHRMFVSAKSLDGDITTLGTLEMVIRVRERRPWSPGSLSTQGPLLFESDPPVPSLEDLWEGKVDFTLRGPHDRKVKCLVSLFEREAEKAIISTVLPGIELPLTPKIWHTHFQKHFQNVKKFREVYDISHYCSLKFDVEELGSVSVNCERDFTPLRWSLRRKQNRFVLRLLDDSGAITSPEVFRIAFETPCLEESLPYSSQYQVPASGGMYVSRTGQFSSALIVPPVVHGFGDLRYVPCIKKRCRNLPNTTHIIKIADLWSRAKLTGNILARTRQRLVVEALICEVFRLICGDNWEKAETKTKENSSNDTVAIQTLAQSLSPNTSNNSLGDTLLNCVQEIAWEPGKSSVELLVSITSSYRLIDKDIPNSSFTENIDPIRWFAEFALRLASNPGHIEVWAGQYLQFGVQHLMDKPILARTARFLVIATNHYLHKQLDPPELYAVWKWT